VITEISAARAENYAESTSELPNIHRTSTHHLMTNKNSTYQQERVTGTAEAESRQPISPPILHWNYPGSQVAEQYRIKPVKKRKIGSRSSNRAAPSKKNFTCKGSILS
jgi:hypothetical protein